MSDDSGSYMRFTKDHHFPSSRPHNTLLSKLVVPTSELEGNIAERGLSTRPQNNKLLISNQRTMFDREANNAVAGGFLSGVATPKLVGGSLTGGSFLTGNHPRLARDPTWYPGRGKQRAVDVFGNVAKTVEGVGNIAAAVAGGRLKRKK